MGLFDSLFGNSSVSRTKNAAEDATRTLNEAMSAQYGDPIYQQLAQTLLGRAQNPYTLSSGAVEQLKARNADDAQTAYTNALAGIRDRAGAAGAYRSGPTMAMERGAAADLGNSIAQGNTRIDVSAAQQRLQDEQSVQNMIAQYIALMMAPRNNLAQGYLGKAGANAQVAGQTTPLLSLSGLASTLPFLLGGGGGGASAATSAASAGTPAGARTNYNAWTGQYSSTAA